MSISYTDIITKTVPILVIFAGQELVIAALVDEHRTLALVVGLSFAFLSLLAVNIAVLVTAVLKIEVNFPEILTATGSACGALVVSDAILLLITEADRAFVCILGMTLAFLGFCSILATAIARKALES